MYAPLGFDAPVSALDAATGQTLATYPETKGAEEIIVHQGIVLVVVGIPAAEQSLVGAEKAGGKKPGSAQPHPAKAIVALRADTGEVLWRNEEPTLHTLRTLTLTASGQHVLFTDGAGTACVELATGRPVWRHAMPVPPPGPLGLSSATQVVCDGVVLVALPEKGTRWWKVTALAADTGEKLWESQCPGGSFSPPDVLVAGGLVWVKGFDAGRDLRTGQVKKPDDVLELLTTAGHHDRCYRNKATDRYLLLGHRGIECLDLVGDGHSRNNWLRGTCQYGILPCNGLIYAPSHACGCYIEAMLHGFWAVAPGRTPDIARNADEAAQRSNEERLERGTIPEAAAAAASPSPSSPDDWPTYRCDAARTGSTPAELPAALAPVWKTAIGGRLSAPVVAGGKVYVCSINEHRVVALDAAQGRLTWSFMAGARVDTPPTVWQDSVLFGSADGWVYCLRASDGRLRWRFLAAADERLTVALDQLESIWPVNGSVLLQDGLAYVAAGRSSYLDGGIRLYALDPRTGRVVHEQRLCSEHPTVRRTTPTAELATLRRGEPDWPLAQNKVDARTYLDPDRSDGFSMDGATTDVLVGDGRSVYLRQKRFDRELALQPQGSRHLYSTTRLIDDAAAHRSHWMLGTGDMRPLGVAYEWSTRTLAGGIGDRCCTVPFGLMLAFDEHLAWGVTKHGDELFAVRLRPPGSSPERDFQPPTKDNAITWLWSGSLPVIARAMVRAGGTVWVAGLTKPAQEGGRRPRGGANETRETPLGSGALAAFSATDGKARGEQPLPAPPVWDGMAVASGRLFLSTLDGNVICMGAK